MFESWESRLGRWRLNWFPAYRGTGGRATFVSHDFREVHIKLPLNWRTRNYVKTIFGGSLYGCVDPVYMIMLIKLLGPAYVVWDKAASIRFRKPGKETLTAVFRVTEEELASIRAEVAANGRAERTYVVNLVSAAGEVHATCEKVLSIKPKTG